MSVVNARGGTSVPPACFHEYCGLSSTAVAASACRRRCSGIDRSASSGARPGAKILVPHHGACAASHVAAIRAGEYGLIQVRAQILRLIGFTGETVEHGDKVAQMIVGSLHQVVVHQLNVSSSGLCKA